MLIAAKSIFQRLYPYGLFTLPPSPKGEGGEVFTGPVAYLTFDDGPIPEVTPKVLEILARYDVKATFFMVGENIDKHPEVFQQVVEAGHSVGNHTYNHLKGITYSQSAYLANVAQCQSAIDRHSVTRFSNRPLFRPPYGKARLSQRRALAQQGYRLIYWDILTRDYDPARSPEQMFAQIRSQIRNGSIINFHDSIKSNERMLAVLPQAIEWLRANGYHLLAIR